MANLAALCYMLPLALGIATMAQVGFAAGARDVRRARVSAGAGLLIACVLAVLIGVLLWVWESALVALYTVPIRRCAR